MDNKELHALQEAKRDSAYVAIGDTSTDVLFCLIANSDILPSTESANKWTYARQLEHKYDFDRRVKTKLGKIIKRLDSGLPDHEVNAFVQAINAKVWNDLQPIIEYGTGKAIQSAYDDIRCGSCMHGKDMSLLVNNPGQVGVIRIKDKARALAWTLGDKTYLDRVYPNDSNNEYHVALVGYAESKGWIIRDDHSLPAGDVTFDGNCIFVELDCVGIDSWPYMDSMHYVASRDSRTIALSSDADDKSEGQMDSTSGEISGVTCCASCGESIGENDARYIEGSYYCDDCYCESFFYCEECEEYIHIDCCNSVNDISICDHCLSSNYTQCEKCDEYHLDENITETADNSVLCNECLTDGYLYCENCDEWHPSDEQTETHDGDYVCKDCLESDYALCAECEEWHRVEDIEYAEHKTYCQDCIENDHSECDYCGAYYPHEKVNSGGECIGCASGYTRVARSAFRIIRIMKKKVA